MIDHKTKKEAIDDLNQRLKDGSVNEEWFSQRWDEAFNEGIIRAMRNVEAQCKSGYSHFSVN